MTRLLTRLLGIAIFTFNFKAVAEEPHSMASDLSHRDAEIPWPPKYDPSRAFVFSHNELLIHADCHRVWTQFSKVTEWPTWFVLTTDVTSDSGSRALQHGTVLRLRIFGTPITAQIDEYAPECRLSWIPMTMEPTKHLHYHTWHFIPEAAGCRVVTEETGIGEDDKKDREQSSRFMHRAHDLWLASLRWKSED